MLQIFLTFHQDFCIGLITTTVTEIKSMESSSLLKWCLVDTQQHHYWTCNNTRMWQIKQSTPTSWTMSPINMIT